MAKIIVINGYPQSGKNLFCQYCQEYMGFKYCKILSSVDFVKRIAIECGWNKDKNAKNRKFLSDLKDLLTEWDDVPFQRIKKIINNIFNNYTSSALEKMIIFVHVREPEEIQRYVNEFEAKTLLIQRPAVENYEQSNHADSEVLNFNYNYIICNNKTKEDLKNKANEFIINLLKEDWKSKISEEEI